RPLIGDFAWHARVSITRKIGEHDLRMRLSRPANFEEIDSTGASRRRTGLGDFGAEQGIDDARLAYVRAAEKRNFRDRRRRELAWRQRRRHESRENAHTPVSGFQEEVASRGTSVQA